MQDKDIKYEGRLLLNFITVLFSRLFKILNALYSVNLYNQDSNFGLLKSNYVKVLNKIIIWINIKSLNSDIINLKEIIKNSGLLDYKSLIDFQEYTERELLEDEVDRILNPIIREIEFLSAKYGVFDKMYYLKNIEDFLKINQNNINNYCFDEIEDIDINIKNEILYDKSLENIVNKFITDSKKLEKKYLNNNEIINLSDKLLYNKNKYLFINKDNDYECSIKLNGNYDKLMDILLKNRGKIVTYVELEKQSGMDVLSRKSDSRDISKRVSDVKSNLYKKLINNLDVSLEELKFIDINKGVKILIK